MTWAVEDRVKWGKLVTKQYGFVFFKG
jgi:hypothetical protein